MATAPPVTPPAQTTGYGNSAGAIVLLATLTLGNTQVPADWKEKSGEKAYAAYVVQWAPPADKTGIGAVLWKEKIEITVGIPGVSIGGPITSSKIEAKQKNFAWNAAGAITGTSDAPTTGGPGSTIDQPSLLQQIGNILSSIGMIFTAEFWKRAGEILLGAVLLIIGMVVLLKLRRTDDAARA